jgi:exonuclease V gamma subunit
VVPQESRKRKKRRLEELQRSVLFLTHENHQLREQNELLRQMLISSLPNGAAGVVQQQQATTATATAAQQASQQGKQPQQQQQLPQQIQVGLGSLVSPRSWHTEGVSP